MLTNRPVMKKEKQVMQKDNQAIRDFLYTLYCPFLNGTLGALEAVGSVSVNDGGVQLELMLGASMASLRSLLASWLIQELEERGIAPVQVEVVTDVKGSSALARHPRLNRVKNVVLVASGKGGVGKSTTAINLALALKAEGAKVGVLDADIYGPSLPTMLGIADDVRPEVVDTRHLEPVYRFGLATMSVAYLTDKRTPMIWRGPMAVKALQQLLEMTLWGELDYLIVDMPPGTGDIHISLAQKGQVSAGIVVTTPQEMALADARKGLEMFNKADIPVLGVVENMATHVCSQCGHEDAIFGCGGAQRLAAEYGTTVLASLPLERQIREHTDGGRPTVVQAPASRATRVYLELAQQMAIALWRANLTESLIPEVQIVS